MAVRDFFTHTGTHPKNFDRSLKRTYIAKDLEAAQIDINTASKEDLACLPGIGEKIAEKIIAFRMHTRFNNPEELLLINGIGKKKFQQCKALITTGADIR
ncbi:MAG: helix-hairpin-helix domain-containing protein [Candidatus Auribacterota bacterium]|jgi:competence protein ComEA|nr:helix-hairpin-helix domain-containing protein [Candidatus Auribacterota bacterium]